MTVWNDKRLTWPIEREDIIGFNWLRVGAP
jgi:hypothetical protein